MNILNKFRSGLIKTSNFLTSNIINSITSKKINPEIIQDIETTLISADIGLEVTDHLISKIKATKINDHVDSTFILKLLSNEISQILLEREENVIKTDDILPIIHPRKGNILIYVSSSKGNMDLYKKDLLHKSRIK